MFFTDQKYQAIDRRVNYGNNWPIRSEVGVTPMEVRIHGDVKQ